MQLTKEELQLLIGLIDSTIQDSNKEQKFFNNLQHKLEKELQKGG